MDREKTANEYTGNGYMVKKIFKRYLPLYEAAVGYLPISDKCNTIVDLGSGVGHFAKILFDKGYIKYIGIDFAPAMLKKSKKQVPEATFILGDLRNEEIHKIIQKHKIFVILETLEHIEKDLDIIKNIPQGSLVIFSVPNYDHPAHVRHFKTINNVIERFEHLLKFKDNLIIRNKTRKIFLFKCIRKFGDL